MMPAAEAMSEALGGMDMPTGKLQMRWNDAGQ